MMLRMFHSTMAAIMPMMMSEPERQGMRGEASNQSNICWLSMSPGNTILWNDAATGMAMMNESRTIRSYTLPKRL